MKGWIKKHLVTLILMGIGLLGMGLILYPTFADWWNSFNQSRAVATYVEAVANLSQGQYDEIIKAAEDYNVRLSENGLRWNLTDEEIAEYEGLLDITGTGIMGYIEIPKINETLPIYHGTDESVLQVAIGHLAGTSLPVGGEGSHCVVSGHRGLPSARLFSDLDKLIAGIPGPSASLAVSTPMRWTRSVWWSRRICLTCRSRTARITAPWSPVRLMVSIPTGCWSAAIALRTNRA